MKTVCLVSINCHGFYSISSYLLRNYALLDEAIRTNYRFTIIDRSIQSSPRIRMYKVNCLQYISDIFFNFSTQSKREFFSWMKMQLKYSKIICKTLTLIRRWQTIVQILITKPDIIGFSCYIWNLNDYIKIAGAIRRLKPKSIIVFGGQEVTNSGDEFLQKYKFIDYVVDGEGEETFLEFLKKLLNSKNKKLIKIPGLVTRGNGTFEKREPIKDIDNIPSPYLDLINNHILMKKIWNSTIGCLVETARGCPFKCSFCFESDKFNTVRHFSIDKISNELIDLSCNGVREFHILDPILCNSSEKRLASLVSIINKLNVKGGLNISVEVYAELLKEELLKHLHVFAAFDVGLQSCNPDVLKNIKRYFDSEKFENGIMLLKKLNKIISVYLIFGLPGESYFSFLKSIMYAINVNPTNIFVNRLFILRGTPLRANASMFNIEYCKVPPYKTQATDTMSSYEMNLLDNLSLSFMHEYLLNKRNEIAEVSNA